MKQFSLKEYLKNPSRKVVTRNGNPAKILCTNYFNPNYPIVAEIYYSEYNVAKSHNFTRNGRRLCYRETPNDLFFETEKHEGWINIYKEGTEIKGKDEGFRGAHIYSSKEKALEAGKLFDGYITTTKIEWED